MKSSNVSTFELPVGFRAAGAAVGIKSGGQPDMALWVSDTPAVVAAVFTTNRVKAAPVHLCLERLAADAPARAVVVNSGNANCCTGEQGLLDARQTAERTAGALGVDARAVWVCSTGPIGKPLPMDALIAGLPELAQALSPDGGPAASEAILTTDTRPKRIVIDFTVGGRPVRLSAAAKGAGMIEPNMATMLAFLMTDAVIEQEPFQAALKEAVDASFNRISVDGDMSTNDSVIGLANGASGTDPLTPDHPDWSAFTDALHTACRTLARAMIEDGEGATRCFELVVTGADSDADADIAARTVARSLLVKTGWSGSATCWGRVMAALGYSTAALTPDRIAIRYGDLSVVENGRSANTDSDALRKVMTQPWVRVAIDLGRGDGKAVLLTCNCTEDYVKINNH